MTKQKKPKQQLGPRQRKWVDALRSGKFKQIEGNLKTTDGFCCLGVACEINKKNLKLTILPIGDSFMYNGDLYTLPDKVKKYFQLHGPSGHDIGNDVSLTYLNDGGKTFKQIARLLESNPARWFKKAV